MMREKRPPTTIDGTSGRQGRPGTDGLGKRATFTPIGILADAIVRDVIRKKRDETR